MKDLLYLIAICKRADNFERGWLMLKRWYGQFYWGDKSEWHFNFYGAIPVKILAENLISIIEKVDICRENRSGGSQYLNLIASISPKYVNYSEYGETRLLKNEPNYDFWLRIVAVFYSRVRLTSVEDLESAGLWSQDINPIIYEIDREYKQIDLIWTQLSSKFGWNYRQYEHSKSGESPSIGFIIRCASLYFRNPDDITIENGKILINRSSINYKYNPSRRMVVFDFYEEYLKKERWDTYFLHLDMEQSAFLSYRYFEEE